MKKILLLAILVMASCTSEESQTPINEKDYSFSVKTISYKSYYDNTDDGIDNLIFDKEYTNKECPTCVGFIFSYNQNEKISSQFTEVGTMGNLEQLNIIFEKTDGKIFYAHRYYSGGVTYPVIFDFSIEGEMTETGTVPITGIVIKYKDVYKIEKIK